MDQQPTITVADNIKQFEFNDLRISLDRDERRAWITLLKGSETGGDGKPHVYEEEEIRTALARTGISKGINEKLIAEVVSGKNKEETLLIAEYVPPTQGKNAEIKYLVDDRRQAAVNPDGSINFRDIGFIKDIKKGQKLLERVPPGPGTPGWTVTGTEIPAISGNDINIGEFLGENTYFDETNSAVVAKTDGFYHRDDRGRVHVLDKLVINSHVDFNTGNIKSRYKLEIQGDVKADFTLSCQNDVLIHGAVEDARMEVGGNLEVKNGIVPGTCPVRVRGLLKTGYIYERKFLEAGSLVAEEMISFSNVWVEDTLQALRLSGGLYIVGKRVEVTELGNKENSKTIVRVGKHPEKLLKMADLRQRQLLSEREVPRLEQQKRQLELNLANLSTTLKALNTRTEGAEQFARRTAERVAQARKEFQQVKREFERKNNILRNLEKELTLLSLEVDYKNPELVVKGRINPGVVVYMGNNPPLRFTRTNNNLTISLNEEGELVTSQQIINEDSSTESTG